METWQIIVLLLVLLLIAAVAALLLKRQRERRQLQERFGPEYDRATREADSRRAAERHLREVAERHDRLDIRPLPTAERERFAVEWDRVQTSFVDQPRAAVDTADILVAQVMRARGYPVEDFGDRADLVAVDHPDVVEHYRAAHAIRERNTGGHADTEDLRTAFVHYRALFATLLRDDASTAH